MAKPAVHFYVELIMATTVSYTPPLTSLNLPSNEANKSNSKTVKLEFTVLFYFFIAMPVPKKFDKLLLEVFKKKTVK